MQATFAAEAEQQDDQRRSLGGEAFEDLDLARLAPKKVNSNDVTMLRPWYVDRRTSERA